ncbi:M15 family metallopeptidase [Candidatus Saccharibacteria bacterium]|nr:M15 family metallopeptidase [Candidatus Saccharibacteria bacterium]
MTKRIVVGILVACVVGLLVGGLAVYLHVPSVNAPSSHAELPRSTAATPKALSLSHTSDIPLLAGDQKQATHPWVLVSKIRPIQPANYIPTDLIKPNVKTRTDKSEAEQMVRSTIAPSVEKMFVDASAAGYDLMVASGFRSYELQQTYFTSYASINGAAAANTYSALPGQSEHQTGLAIDISTANSQCYLDICFGETPAGKWLAANAANYGFILRYPNDKTAVTQYQYEPWHFRYVGIPLAKALTKSNLTLDEAQPYFDKAYEQ